MLRAKSIHHQRHLIAILDIAGDDANGEPVGYLELRRLLGRRSLSQQLLQSFFKLLLLFQHRFDSPGEMLRLCLEHPRRLGQPVLQFDSVPIGRRTREGFDASHARGGTGFVREAKQRDLPRRADMRPAAQLERHATNVHDADHVVNVSGRLE